MPAYQPTADDWAGHDVDGERERLLSGIDTLMQMDVSEQFRAPGKCFAGEKKIDLLNVRNYL